MIYLNTNIYTNDSSSDSFAAQLVILVHIYSFQDECKHQNKTYSMCIYTLEYICTYLF